MVPVQRGELWWLDRVVRLEWDDFSWRCSRHGHSTTLERANRVGKTVFPEGETLLRRAKELCPLQLLLQNTAIDGRMVEADQGVCGPLLNVLRVCGRRTGRGGRRCERRSSCTPWAPLRLLIRRAKDWASLRFGVERRTSRAAAPGARRALRRRLGSRLAGHRRYARSIIASMRRTRSGRGGPKDRAIAIVQPVVNVLFTESC